MFGKKRHLSPLESRKQLLIAASELNRAQLAVEWQTMMQETGNLAQLARSIAAWASSTALPAIGVLALRRRPSPVAAKPTWFREILNGANMASTVWLAFDARRSKEEPK
jgi:hypothetical protein